MKTLVLSACIVLALSSTTWASDWKFIGGLPEKKEGTIIVYYDTQSIQYVDKNIRVWVEGVKMSEIEKIRKNNEKQIVAAVADKIALGYITPYSTVIPKTSFDDHITIIGIEEAMLYSPQAYIKIFWEINCSEKQVKTLSAVIYEKDGSTSNSSNDSWEYIPPDSNSEVLEKILCK